MEIIDISWPITQDITAYKDKRTVSFQQTKLFEKDNARESAIALGSHTGTHVDAPSHFMKDGATLEKIDLGSLIGKCHVFDMTSVDDGITADHLENKTIPAHDIVLFKTKNSALAPTKEFNPQFVYLHASGAQLLVKRNVRAVGVDYLGIERGQPDHDTHVLLMKHNITIIEGLRLQHVQEGTYFLCCLPLYTVGLEAAPARAVLIKGL